MTLFSHSEYTRTNYEEKYTGYVNTLVLVKIKSLTIPEITNESVHIKKNLHIL